MIATMRDTIGILPSVAQFTSLLKKQGSQLGCIASHFEATVARYPDRSAIVFEGRELTWRAFNAQANRYAHALKSKGVVKGDVVSVMMENRPEFLAIIVALNKLGAVAALLNTNLQGKALAHCVRVAKSRNLVVGAECLESVETVRAELASNDPDYYLFVADTGADSAPDWVADLSSDSVGQSEENLPQTADNSGSDPALYIYTSGTTGLPKAAIMSNRRYVVGAIGASRLSLRCDRFDRIYLCLPLYHATGLMIGVGSAFMTGASIYLRRRFSASQFLSEVREYDVTCCIYIGELCRYLMQQPEKPDDWDSPLTTVMGNGLRPDIWHAFKRRFGLSRVSEFYGASEGNVAFMNLFNKDCTVGTTSLPVALVAYDVDADELIRDERGRCVKVPDGEPGLLLGKITKQTVFEGYTDPGATDKKVLRNVFEDGDAWFNTGDLLKTVDVGFAMGRVHYQFVDRVGDTFRWKSENVSTNEVGELINAQRQVAMCNVFGVEVPGADGRAGMAALALAEGESVLDIDDFSRHVMEHLPDYARPVFVRVLGQMDTTGTFKLVKTTLRKEGYDPTTVSDPLYVLKPRSKHYELLTPDFAQQIVAGTAGY